MRNLACLLFIALVAGCGLVYQGRTQELDLVTTPPGAEASFRGLTVTTPARVRLSRRWLGYAVYRAEKPGYHPACRIVSCGTPRWIKVLDSIPAAIPLLIDVIAGSLGNCDEPTLHLEAIEPSDVSFELPSDEHLLRSFSYQYDPCTHPYLLDQDFARQASSIIVTSGNIQRRYRTLGPVDFGVRGQSYATSITLVTRGAGFTRTTWYWDQATPEQVNEVVRRRALWLYGTNVDAVINVAYQKNPSLDVYATGLAVAYVNEAPRTPPSATERLAELKRAFEQGLITQEEYKTRRGEILREM